MNEYQVLECYLKILCQNLAVLHHNIKGPSWFEVHGVIDEYQEELDEFTDDIIEAGIRLGYGEPTIAEAVLKFQTSVLPSIPRERDETYGIIMEAFIQAANMMRAAETITPPDVQNKLQEVEYWLHKEAEYKIRLALGKTNEPDYEDD